MRRNPKASKSSSVLYRNVFSKKGAIQPVLTLDVSGLGQPHPPTTENAFNIFS